MKYIFAALLTAFFFSCATNIYTMRPYDPNGHESAMEEWAGHEQTKEWWYCTGVLLGEAGEKFFYQFTIFHGYRFGVEGFAVHLALTDFQTGKHYFLQSNGLPDKTVFCADSGTVYRNSSVTVETDKAGNLDRMLISGKARDFSFNLEAVPLKGPAWHGENGIVIMGHEQKKNERSFYYSYTRMHTSGSLEVRSKLYQVKGSSWFDRQWGVFTELYWEWFSLRLDDQREIMIFRFPDTGYTAGTMIDSNGDYRQLGQIGIAEHNPQVYSKGKHSYSLGWKLDVEGEEFVIVPLLENQSNNATGLPSYWEGLCIAEDSDGGRLGWCVVESTSPIF